MKTVGNLWPQLIGWSNMLLALQRCRRRKRFSLAAAEFDFDSMNNLLCVHRELVTFTWVPGDYHHFEITDPKPRRISAAPFRDRVVHHAIVNVLEPLYERRFVFDSYACRRGKGTHRAIQRAQQFLRRYPWTLKTDIVRFFPTVDHELLLQRLQRVIRDARMMQLITLVVDSGRGILDSEAPRFVFPGDDLFSQLRPRGLPIGNLTSQFFANVYLDSLDHFIREELRVPGYVRYADDLVLFGHSRAAMWEYRAAIEAFAAGLRLRLHEKKTHAAPATQPLNFLGMRISRDQIRLSSQGLRRFTRRLRQMQNRLDSGGCSFADIRGSIQAWLAHTRQANSTGLIRTVLKRLRLRRRRRADS